MPYRFVSKSPASSGTIKLVLTNIARLNFKHIIFLVLLSLFYVVFSLLYFGHLWKHTISNEPTSSVGSKSLDGNEIKSRYSLIDVSSPLGSVINNHYSALRRSLFSVKDNALNGLGSIPTSVLSLKYFDSLLGLKEDKSLMKKCIKMDSKFEAIENRLAIGAAEPWGFRGTVSLDPVTSYKHQFATRNQEASNEIQRLNNSQVYWIDDLSNLYNRFKLKSNSLQNIILGIAEDIDEINFGIFSGSFKNHSGESSLIVFMNVEAYKARVQQMSLSDNINIILYSRKQMRPNFLQSYHSSSLRWVLYSYLLEGFRNHIRTATADQNSNDNRDTKWLSSYIVNIMVVDVRDTLFQRDPFTFCKSKDSCENRIITGSEESNTIESCSWNTRWVKACFSDNLFQAVKGASISCSGFSIGSSSKLLEYINLMSDILLGKSHLSKKFPVCEENGVDQGIHNVILSLGLIEGFDSIPEYYYDAANDNISPVVNLQSSSVASKYLEQGNKITEIRSVQSTSLYPVVHQYDRLFKYQLEMVNKYANWVNATDFEGHIRADSCSNNYEFIENYDIFKGVCDYKVRRTITITSCCEMCNQIRDTYFSDLYARILSGDRSPSNEEEHLQQAQKNNICTGFSYIEGNCFLKTCDSAKNSLTREFFRMRYQTSLTDSEMGTLDTDVKYLNIRSSIQESKGLYSALLF